jgi:hemerythrin-like domain-containing protein
MKATELLQRQHRDIEALLERLHTAGQGEEDRIRHELAATLVAHTKIEQELFYPAVRTTLPLETTEALEEHGLVDVQLARLLAHAADGDVGFEAKAAVLAELVVRHIRREESEILKLAERELGDEHLHLLGEKMGLRFRQVVEAGFQKPLQKALMAELPRTPRRARAAKGTARRAAAKGTARRAAAKKTARRAPAAKTAKAPRREAAPSRATRRTGPQRTGKPTTKRAATSRAMSTGATSSRQTVEKPARAARARRAPARAARARA